MKVKIQNVKLKGAEKNRLNFSRRVYTERWRCQGKSIWKRNVARSSSMLRYYERRCETRLKQESQREHCKDERGRDEKNIGHRSEQSITMIEVGARNAASFMYKYLHLSSKKEARSATVRPVLSFLFVVVLHSFQARVCSLRTPKALFPRGSQQSFPFIESFPEICTFEITAALERR